MFKDCFVAREKAGRPAPEKLVGLLVSLLVHGFLVYAVVHARFTVKVMTLRQEEVRSVMIVPPLKASIPKIVGGQAAPGVPEGLTEEEPSLEAGRPGDRGAPEAAPGPTPGPLDSGTARASPQLARPDAPPGSSAVPSLSSRFRESMSSGRRGDGASGLSIALAPPGTPPGPPGGYAGPVTGPYPDFSKYIAGPFDGPGSGYGAGSGRRGRGTSGGQRIGISIPLKGYDLTPWALQVVDRLQRFWDLPAVTGAPGEAAIRIIVVIKKTGELDSLEILENTSAEALDRAAIQALRASLPFPELPADFPGDFLEIHFEFVYSLQ
ncbi:MAG: TonB C-terminal domain-containing protein [Candidatus Aminicenantes bacterium]